MVSNISSPHIIVLIIKDEKNYNSFRSIIYGRYRLSRVKYFILNSVSVAQNMNFSSSLIKKEVPNIGHQQVNMAAFAAQKVF